MGINDLIELKTLITLNIKTIYQDNTCDILRIDKINTQCKPHNQLLTYHLHIDLLKKGESGGE